MAAAQAQAQLYFSPISSTNKHFFILFHYTTCICILRLPSPIYQLCYRWRLNKDIWLQYSATRQLLQMPVDLFRLKSI